MKLLDWLMRHEKVIIIVVSVITTWVCMAIGAYFTR
nr:MAG TPA: Picornaviridae P3A protein [Caudoviricetes sp.]